MTSRYAIVRDADSTVVNIVMWDGDTTKWQPPAGHTARLATSSDAIPVPVDQQNQQSIVAQAQGAMQANRDFVALASPSNTQVVNQVKALSQQNNRIIRLLLNQFDNTN